MAIVDLQTFKSYMKATRLADAADDALLTAALAAAHDGVRQITGRNINTADATATERFFRPRVRESLWIDDAAEVTSIVDDTFTMTVGTDYQLEPVGNRSSSGEYRPYSEVRRRGGWSDSWDGFATVSVTAKWGWTTLPTGAVEAVKILGKDILANRDVSFGIAGFTEFAGVRARANPQVWLLLAPLSLRTYIG